MQSCFIELIMWFYTRRSSTLCLEGCLNRNRRWLCYFLFHVTYLKLQWFADGYVMFTEESYHVCE